MDEPELLHRLEEIARLAAVLDDAATKFNSELSYPPRADAAALKDFLDTIDGLQLPQGEIIGDLLPVLTDGALRQRLEKFGEQIRVYRELRKAVEAAFGQEPDLDHARIGEVRNAVATVLSILPIARMVADLDRIAGELEKAATRITEAQAIYTDTVRRLGCDLSFARSGLSLVSRALTLLRNAPLTVLHLRHAGLKREGIDAIIRAAQSEAAPICVLRADLSQRLHLDLVPAFAEVRQHAMACVNTGRFSFLNRKFRAAKRAHAAMARTAGKPSQEQMRQDFRKLSEYLDRAQRFKAKRAYQEVA